MAKARAANICLNVTSSLTHIELLQYDVLKGNFSAVDAEEVHFDPASREPMEGPDKLKTSIKRLFDRNKIPAKTPTTVVLPSFFTRQYALPENVMGEELKGILTAEAERFYVFKKIDPEVGFCTLPNGQVLYTAYPKTALETIKKAIFDLKIPLVSVDSNYTATLRGLVSMGVIQQEIDESLKWGLMIISDFNVFLAVVEGNNIEKTLEAPLPLQNVEEAALMQEIREDFKEFFGYEVLSRMVIVNNARKIFSPTLVENLDFRGATDVFDQNPGTLASYGVKDAPFPCSLESVGAALVRIVSQVPAVDLHDIAYVETFVDEDRQNLIGYSLIGAGVVLLGIQFGVTTLITNLVATETQKSSALQAEVNKTLNSLQIVPVVKRKLFIKQGLEQNTRVSNLVVKVAQFLPPDAWLKELNVKTNTDMKTIAATIKGGTLSSDPLMGYVKELNKEVGAPPLVPNVVPQQQEEQRYFDYTLTNDSEGSASVPGGAPGGTP